MQAGDALSRRALTNVETLSAPARLPPAADVWQEIEAALEQFDTLEGFVGPCELRIVAAT
jgi:hypothetical protein